MGHGAATPPGLRLRECVGLQSPVLVSGHPEKENTGRQISTKEMKMKRQAPSHDRVLKGGSPRDLALLGPRMDLSQKA